MKRRVYPFLLVAVFLLGCLGHLLFRPKPPASAPCLLTLEVENANNLLLYSLPDVGDTVCISGISGKIVQAESTPRTLYERERGELFSRSSLFTSNVTFKVKVDASMKDGRLSLGAAPLFLGDTVTLSGNNFSFSARLREFSANF